MEKQGPNKVQIQLAKTDKNLIININYVKGGFTLVRSSKHVPDHYTKIFNIN